MRTMRWAVCLAMLGASPAGAQAPAAAAPRLWEVEVGASFVGSAGNSESSSLGANFEMHRRWPGWAIESSAAAIRTSSQEVETAERYLGAFRGVRRLTPWLGASGGTRLEQDRFSGIEFRSITDGGLTWSVVRRTGWELEAVTAAGLNHERPTAGPVRDTPVGRFEARNTVTFGTTGAATQRVTFYPDFAQGNAHRAELELTARAAMTTRLGLEFGYLVRRSNAPREGFRPTDRTATASVVMRWRADEPAPPQ